MLQHVWERAGRSRLLDRLVVATDDDRILRAAKEFGAAARMTEPGHRSGTDRTAEVAASDAAAIIVNIQGDEPLIDPEAIDAAISGLVESTQAPMSTLGKEIEDPCDLENPNVVKVVADLAGNALYFSRSAIPFARSGRAAHYKHIGIYVYRREFLLAYASLPVGPLEEAEKLEQLRALESGHKIRVVETRYESLGVDTPEDLERVRVVLEAGVRVG